MENRLLNSNLNLVQTVDIQISYFLCFQVKTNELVGPGIHVHFKLSHDGSGKGAALVTSSVEGSRRQSVQEVSP